MKYANNLSVTVRNGHSLVKIGVVISLLYWLSATVHSTILVSEVSFISRMFQPEPGDLTVRIIMVVAILGLSIYGQRRITLVSQQLQELEHKSEERQYALDTAGFAVLVLDDQGRIESMNKSAVLLTGFKLDEMLKRVALDVLFFPKEGSSLSTVMNNPIKEPIIVRMRTKRLGGEIYVLVNSTIEKTAENMIKTILVLQPVTGFVRSKQIYKENYSRILQAVSSANIPMAIVGLDSIKELNKSLHAWLGITPHDVIDRDYLATILSPADLEDFIEGVKLATQGSVSQRSMVLNGGPQSGSTVLVILSPLPTPEGVHVLIQLVNLTPMIEREQELQTELKLKITNSSELKEQLKEMERQNKQFIQNSEETSASVEQLQSEKRRLQKQYDEIASAFREASISADDRSFELEHTLRDMEIDRDRVSAILEFLEDGIIITDMYNRVVLMNKAAEDILGVRLSQVLDRPIHHLIRDRKFMEQIQSTLSEQLTDNRFTTEIRVVNREAAVALEMKSKAILNKDVREIGVITCFKPIA